MVGALEAIGGQIFEPNAIVYAEEPDALEGLWKQRVRWGRGNVQITSVYRDLWCNASAHRTMGSRSMALLWFSIFLMPFFQIGASVGLVALYFVSAPAAWLRAHVMAGGHPVSGHGLPAGSPQRGPGGSHP